MSTGEDLHRLSDLAKEHGSAATAAISQSVAQAAHSTEDAIHRVADSSAVAASRSKQWLTDRAAYLKDRSTEGVEVLRGQVQQHTLASVGIAFGVGVGLAWLLFRR